MTDIIDESGRVPTLRNRRVTIFDVILTMNVNPDPQRQFKDVWNLSGEQIEEIENYVEENRRELEKLGEELQEESS